MWMGARSSKYRETALLCSAGGASALSYWRIKTRTGRRQVPAASRGGTAHGTIWSTTALGGAKRLFTESGDVLSWASLVATRQEGGRGRCALPATVHTPSLPGGWGATTAVHKSPPTHAHFRAVTTAAPCPDRLEVTAGRICQRSAPHPVDGEAVTNRVAMHHNAERRAVTQP